jgi:N-acetylmuramoyl-L-alanine amidase
VAVWRKRSVLVSLLVAVVIGLLPVSAVTGATSRFYPQTGYAIDDPHFQDYFDHRGGVRAFGYPVSHKFLFLGFPVQIFQRAVMQLFPDGHVALMNLLDDTLFPYTQVNGAMFPAFDPTLAATAPAVGSPNYAQAVLTWIANNTPDSWNGLPVVFRKSFMSTVRPTDVLPAGVTNPGLLAGFNLEVWGLPTSRPAVDPKNSKFVYQRFQRGILHYDQTTGTTQGILLADYFKSVLMAENLPPDLVAQAKQSPFYGQYNPLKPGWVDRPASLPSSDLSHAFEPSPIIALDPGHGGAEIGASAVLPTGTILREKDLNLTVASRVATLLKQAGYPVIQTRTADTWVDVRMINVTDGGPVTLADDLQMRADMANKAHATLFLSTHFNGYMDPSVRGTTVYYDQARQFSRRNQYFASLIDAEAITALTSLGEAPFDRGVQTDSQAVGQGQHFYVLGPDATRPTQMPGALVEGLFLTNPLDAQHLADPKTIEALAQAYAHAIEDYYGQGH